MMSKSAVDQSAHKKKTNSKLSKLTQNLWLDVGSMSSRSKPQTPSSCFHKGAPVIKYTNADELSYLNEIKIKTHIKKAHYDFPE